MRSAIILFPGTNRERDMAAALKRASGRDPAIVWHAETTLPAVDLIVLPGGFSFGDYLRAGAIAARSPVMAEVVKRANEGVLVLGVCNGFQSLCEVGLLPGVLMRNASLKFVCREVKLEIANTQTPFTHAYRPRQIIRCPVAHHDGNYFADEATLDRLEGEGRIAFRYAEGTNPNGSRRDIAGILSERGNVLGMMPHPEDMTDEAHGALDGLGLFRSIAGIGEMAA
ncbi:phosphoribosylformylglycinamidine synthase subunit PurQ [Propylenella binzhouense]|uniref:Phosphoribosylformylglycinamidine synthase subunit PurQ n=1 Tax=Propylenella binzhouense TaxID=2555902 RepID=A0A964T468_9HYPH|nr:phosphoribosylformylglycinamidine synthase subunit PurQ [Propylenella binzhouense]MYZ48075.1 phosphoribosylformylglycinamidine synthase subunit PurQ [Propylenella binzhouense]